MAKQTDEFDQIAAQLRREKEESAIGYGPGVNLLVKRALLVIHDHGLDSDEARHALAVLTNECEPAEVLACLFHMHDVYLRVKSRTGLLALAEAADKMYGIFGRFEVPPLPQDDEKDDER